MFANLPLHEFLSPNTCKAITEQYPGFVEGLGQIREMVKELGVGEDAQEFQWRQAQGAAGILDSIIDALVTGAEAVEAEREAGVIEQAVRLHGEASTGAY